MADPKAVRARVLIIAGISDVVIAGVLLVLTVMSIIDIPILVPLLLMVAGIGIAIGAVFMR